MHTQRTHDRRLQEAPWPCSEYKRVACRPAAQRKIPCRGRRICAVPAARCNTEDAGPSLILLYGRAAAALPSPSAAGRPAGGRCASPGLGSQIPPARRGAASATYTHNMHGAHSVLILARCFPCSEDFHNFGNRRGGGGGARSFLAVTTLRDSSGNSVFSNWRNYGQPSVGECVARCCRSRRACTC